MLTGKSIFDKGIVTNADEKNIQQVGVDLRVKKIFNLDTSIGIIPKEGKTQIPGISYESRFDGNDIGTYHLSPGYYEVVFEEGCNVPSNVAVKPFTRSSLIRCGVMCDSGVFDPGFKTDNMGCFITVLREIYIEKGARLAQLLAFECDEVANLYDGQFQSDKQRK